MVEEFIWRQNQPISKEEAKYRNGIAVEAAQYVVSQPQWRGYSGYLFGSLVREEAKWRSDIDEAFVPGETNLVFNKELYRRLSEKLQETVDDFRLQSGIYVPIRPVLIYRSWLQDPTTTHGIYQQVVIDINREGKRLV